ncbi:methyl-accepting chemotaxis protein [Dongshaea marina]|uniref:methyl-accepting chemotaxis protein n=1 Tax=Dongshaea marina TaxID=2047966 RepID=UPI000D3E7FDB|nr:methyl-accepting chemotaxis protein [Dongshaea marina]
MSIKQKLILAFLATTILPLLIISLFVVNKLRTEAQEQFANSSTREIRQVDNALDIYFQTITENVNFFATDPLILAIDESITDYMNAPKGPMTPDQNGGLESQIFKQFKTFGDSHPGYAYIYLGTVNGGYIQWPKGDTRGNYDPRIRPWYKSGQDGSGQVIRTEAYYYDVDDAVLVSSVRSFNLKNGQPGGTIGIDVSLKGLTNIIKKIKLGKTGYLMLVEDTGNILVDASNPEHNFKKINELGAAYQKLGSMDSGAAELELNGTDMMVNVYVSPSLGWKFIGLIDKSEIMASANQITYTIMVIGIILAILFALLGGVLAQLIANPIRQVTSSLHEIAEGEGDLRRTIDIKGKDETAQLADNFNRFLSSIRNLVTDIKGASVQVGDASEQATGISTEMTDAAGRQSQAVDMVSTAFHEMVATANEVARNCVQAAESAEEGQQQTQEGQTLISDTVNSVGELSGAIKESADAIHQLEQESNNITTILDTIRGIAEQTNLLALNAAIEAARAGEQGRGFAVVADEVRALAQRTSDSTEEINDLLEKLAKKTREVAGQMNQSLNKSEDTVSSTGRVQEAFSNIQNSVTVIKDMNTQIAAAAEEQHQVAEEINRHIEQIHTDAGLVSEVAGSAQSNSSSLSDLAGELNSLVGRFKS